MSRFPRRLGGGTAKAAVALDAGELRAAVWRFTGALTPFLVLVGALLVAAAWIQVSIGLRPLGAMRNALVAIRTGERRRLGSGYPDEVQPLAREIDSLLDARDAQLEKARARAADLAHGLKTPLQVLSGEAERLKKQGEVDSRRRHREHYRGYAAAHRETSDTSAAGAAKRGRIRPISATWPSGLPAWSSGRRRAVASTGRSRCRLTLAARIDADDLAEALGNLIDNATRHARSKVTISGAEERDLVALTIFDDGPGIPASRREDALRRGERLDASGPGSGVGLAIVADIAEVLRRHPLVR